MGMAFHASGCNHVVEPSKDNGSWKSSYLFHGSNLPKTNS